MGASSLTCRAGSARAGTATDGGRDLEAIFDRPSPEGELDRQQWWIECKGRTETVERGAVQQAVLDASGRIDIDVLVVATNSRFSNPTRDWLADRARSSPRPAVKLWDRDKLDRLVRQYPTVAARVLPGVLPDIDRLRLLVARFYELGEEPTVLDREFFWERRMWLAEQETTLLVHAIAMFLYAEGLPLPRHRPWWRLLRVDDIPDAVITALIFLPSILGRELARPPELLRILAAAGRILIACLLLSPEDAASLTLNPWKIVQDGEAIADDEAELRDWHADVLQPVLAFIRSDLLEACSKDCARMTADNPHETDSLSAKGYWSLLCEGVVPEDGVIIIEDWDKRCTIDLDVSLGCPLLVSNHIGVEQLVRQLQAVLEFRQANPDDRALPGLEEQEGALKITFLEDHGSAYTVHTVRETPGPEHTE